MKCKWKPGCNRKAVVKSFGMIPCCNKHKHEAMAMAKEQEQWRKDNPDQHLENVKIGFEKATKNIDEIVANAKN